MELRRIMVLVVAIFSLLGWALRNGSMAQTPAKDTGLVTQVKGPVKYLAGGHRPEEPQAFMKVRLGDRFVVDEGGVVEIVFFQSGRQELWKGPATFRVGEMEGEPDRGFRASPEVKILPTGAGEGIRKVPDLLRKAGLTRSGGMQVRGLPGVEATTEGSPKALTPGEEMDIPKVRELYKEMRMRASPEDVTPELFFLGALSGREGNGEMEFVILEALKRRPQDPMLGTLLEWVRAQKPPSR